VPTGPLLSIDIGRFHATGNHLPAIVALVLIAAFFFKSASAVAPQWLQIPFYKRAGFLEIYANVCGSLVKPSIAKSIG
jgi:hypothetical protein